MAKVDVNGDAADPLWKWMKAEKPGLLGRETIVRSRPRPGCGRHGQRRWGGVANELKVKRSLSSCAPSLSYTPPLAELVRLHLRGGHDVGVCLWAVLG